MGGKQRTIEPKVHKLTPKQEAFCRHYVLTGSATEAYRLAYNASGMKATAIHSNAKKLLRHTPIRLRIAELRAELAARHDIKLDDLVGVLKPLVFSDIRKVMQWGDSVAVTDKETGKVTVTHGVSIISSDKLTPDAAATISEISQSADGTIRVKMYDKLGATDKIAKLLGLIKDQVEITGANGGPIEHQDVPQAPDADHLADIAARYRKSAPAPAPAAKAAIAAVPAKAGKTPNSSQQGRA